MQQIAYESGIPSRMICAIVFGGKGKIALFELD